MLKHIEILRNYTNQMHLYIDSLDKEQVENFPRIQRNDGSFYVLDFHMYLDSDTLVYVELLPINRILDWKNWWYEDYSVNKNVSEDDEPYVEKIFLRLDKGEQASRVFVYLKQVLKQLNPPVVITDKIFAE